MPSLVSKAWCWLRGYHRPRARFRVFTRDGIQPLTYGTRLECETCGEVLNA